MQYLFFFFFCSDHYNEDSSDGGNNEGVVPDVKVQKIEAEVEVLTEEPTACVENEECPEFGPHIKFSTGEELYHLRKELAKVNEKSFYVHWKFSLNLLVGCCRTRGCSNVPNVKHHLVCTTLVVTTRCKAGHIFKFASSREVNGL